MPRLGAARAEPPQYDIKRRDAVDCCFYSTSEVFGQGHIILKDRCAGPLFSQHGLIDAAVAKRAASFGIAWALLLSSLLCQLLVCAEVHGWPEFEPSSQTLLAKLAENVVAPRLSAWALEVDDQPEATLQSQKTLAGVRRNKLKD